MLTAHRTVTRSVLIPDVQHSCGVHFSNFNHLPLACFSLCLASGIKRWLVVTTPSTVGLEVLGFARNFPGVVTFTPHAVCVAVNAAVSRDSRCVTMCLTVPR